MNRWTIKELNSVNDNFILRQLVGEKLNKLTNPYSPLSQRLQKIHDKISQDLREVKIED